LLAIVRAAVDGVSARHAVSRALEDPQFTPFFSQPTHVIAVGKAASAMATALALDARVRPRTLVAIGTHAVADMPTQVEWHQGAHPLPDARSVAAGRRALEVASRVGREECLVLLLSGGASSLMAVPGDGLTLEEKQRTIHTMMLAGADIHALNVARKHLSGVKGGRLAAACPGTTLTLAISDVVGDDLSIIGSGPGVADASTDHDARQVLRQFAPGSDALPLSETPKPGDEVMSRAYGFVIASRTHAIDAACAAAAALGYQPVALADEITGEARAVATGWLQRAQRAAVAAAGPSCVVSAGETTVHVTGRGRGGRNQEFVLALIDAVAASPLELVVASVGTDGIDGPTDAAGALADRTSQARARQLGLDARAHLAHNNAYEFFASLGDLIHLGRTDTNVGDLQLLLTAPPTR
jgi:hydroxypyruvate reductase